jgi:hypothetical protein
VAYSKSNEINDVSDEDLEIKISNEEIVKNNTEVKSLSSNLTQKESLKTSKKADPVLVDQQLNNDNPESEAMLVNLANSENPVYRNPNQKTVENKNNDLKTKQQKNTLKMIDYSSEGNNYPITIIQTDKSRNDLIHLARSNPDSLTYDELLLAADLIPSAKEKLKVYRSAFIRIERDSRAYLNASQIAGDILNNDEEWVYDLQARLLYKSKMNLDDIDLVIFSN